jgi:molybdopterin/thiamine biosynthesis adenylyltransferase/proteasome lid subunit RPN8/RPN11
VTSAGITFLQQHADELRNHLFSRPGIEGAAFILCGESRGPTVAKLVSHAVVPISDEDILQREVDRLSISSRALMRIAKLARYEQLSIVFAHSHPFGPPHFSEQDDGEEMKLMPFLQARVPNRIHGTVVLTPDSIAGRLYVPERRAVDQIVVIGSRLCFYSSSSKLTVPEAFDRQVRAFGSELQHVLNRLHIGVVGLGGTGSAVAELIYRLGVGRMSLFDGDTLASSNLNRVYGSTADDEGKNKTLVAKQHLDRIGFGTDVRAIPNHITQEDIAGTLRDCDIVFGCTDKQLPRAILTQLSLKYHIPVLDMGVLIDSAGGTIRGIHGRVTTLMAGEACLFCRGRISTEGIRVETLPPEERRSQAREGYAPELEEPAPAVIAFTSSIASAAVAELLHRISGFMGKERMSSEVLFAFDESRVRTNRITPKEACFCSDVGQWGRGDEDPLLGMVWAAAPPN